MRRTVDGLAVEVAALGDLDRNALAMLWQKAHRQPPPKAIRNDLLARSAAWHLQAKRLGGLSTGTRRLLREAMADVERASAKLDGRHISLVGPIVDGDAVSDTQQRSEHPSSDPSGGRCMGRAARRARAIPSPGARLVREWNGKNHVVDVIEGGFVFQARVHNVRRQSF